MRFNIQEFLRTFPWAQSPCQVWDYDGVFIIDNIFEFDTDEEYVKIICVDDDGKHYVHPTMDVLISEKVHMKFLIQMSRKEDKDLRKLSVQTVKIVDGLPVGNWEPMVRA